MSISGHLCFYVEQLHRPPHESVRAIAQLVGAQRVSDLIWQSRQQESWSTAKEDDDIGDDALELTTETGAIAPAGAIPWVRQVLARDVDVEDALKLMRESGVHEMFFPSGTPIATHMNAALTKVPESIRNGFVPCSPGVTIGPHDLYEVTTSGATLFGAAALSLSLFGYGAPHDWRQYRALVFNLPEVRDFRARMERTLETRVHACVYWET